MRVRNALFSACIIASLCLPCALFIAEKSGLQVSDVLTTDRAKYLSGGVSDVNVGANFNIGGFASGAFQDSLSDEVDNYIPFKYYVLLGDAELQRTFIEASNVFFNWNCYQTMFDTNIIYVPEYDTVRAKAVQALTPQEEGGLRRFAEEIGQWAASHPDIQISVFIPEQSTLSECNPSSRLTSNPQSLSECLDALNEGVSNVENVGFISKSYSNMLEHLEDFYYTDDHWNGFGAFAACNEIARQFNLLPVDSLASSIFASEYVFNGANARYGLMLLDRMVSEPQFDTGVWRVSGVGSNALLLDPQSSPVEGSPSMEFNFYANWYGGNGETSIINPNAPNDDRVLMVGDSFGQALRWAMATTCREVHWNLCTAISDSETLENAVADCDASKIVFVLTLSNCTSFVADHPFYFGIAGAHQADYEGM